MKKNKIVEIIRGINMEHLTREIYLLLDNNYGEKVQTAISNATEKDLSKSELLTVKTFIIIASMDALKWFIDREVNFTYSNSTLIKALKEIDLKNLNSEIIDYLKLTKNNTDYLKSKM